MLRFFVPAEDERDHVTATMLYDTRLMQDEATWPLGDECACYGCEFFRQGKEDLCKGV